MFFFSSIRSKKEGRKPDNVLPVPVGEITSTSFFSLTALKVSS